MCGLVGVLSINSDASDIIINSLKKLEYRGYDSCGISLLSNYSKIIMKKSVGKVENLEEIIKKDPNFIGNIGIGHTRWATHGKVTEANSHPHFTDKVSLVHNGIIENYEKIKSDMVQKGYEFKTQTDTESIVILMTYFLDSGFNIEEAFKNAINELEGSFALAVIFNNEPNKIFVAKRGSPLSIGYDNKTMNIVICSDVKGVSDYITHALYLIDGEYAFIDCQLRSTDSKIEDLIKIFNKEGQVEKNFFKFDQQDSKISKNGYETFTIKEIKEQPFVLTRMVNKMIEIKDKVVFNFPKFNFSLASLSEINIVACGTSYYSGLTAAYYFEKYAKVNVNVHIASEFKYRNFNFKKNGVFIFISQSGETADTISALKYAKENNQKILSILNAKQSSMESLSDCVLNCDAGVEVGVASTKGFTSQLVMLIMLSLRIGLKKSIIRRSEGRNLSKTLLKIGDTIGNILKLENEIKLIAKEISSSQNIILMGRNVNYGIALEGALKIKELTYIPTEAFPAGELKHGPIALINNKTPTIVIAPSDSLFSKISSNIYEVLARDANVVLISDKYGISKFSDVSEKNMKIIETPVLNEFISPIGYTIILQLLAYHVALNLNRDIDRPKNLAKSVTVE